MLTPCHWPLAQLAARRALNAEVPGWRPGRPASFLRVSFKGQDGTLRTFRLGFDSSYPYQVCGRSSNRTGHSAPNAEIGVGIPTGRPVSRWWPSGKPPDCRSGPMASTPIHRAIGLSSNGRISGPHQRVRVRLSPALPRGCRLIGQDRCLSSSGCGIVTRRPYQIFGL